MIHSPRIIYIYHRIYIQKTKKPFQKKGFLVFCIVYNHVGREYERRKGYITLRVKDDPNLGS